MSGPVAVDATLNAMLEMMNRAAKDADFRRLCATDMAAAVASLENRPAEGTSFEFAEDANAQVLRVHRGGETTTITRTADGQVKIDNDGVGLRGRADDDDELSDFELAAVAGGCTTDYCNNQPTILLKKQCKAIATCYGYLNWAGWDRVDGCDTQTIVACIGFNIDSSWSMLVPCETSGGSY